MMTITAIIRAKPGQADAVKRALLEVAESVRCDEPGTIGYFVTQSGEQPEIFTTYERFVDAAAMERHNDSPAVARFVDVAGPVLAEKVVIHTGRELLAK